MEVKVKIKRNYEPKSTLAVLISYKKGLQRLVKFIYPDDWISINSIYTSIHTASSM